jgi:hypothetical protein
MKEVLMEVKHTVKGFTEDDYGSKSDWHYLKSRKYSQAAVKSYQKQAKKLIQDPKYHQIHIVVLDPEGNDPLFQEFYYKDLTTFKMF